MKKGIIKGTTTGLAGAVAIAGGTQAYGSVVTVTPPANITPTSGATAATSRAFDINGDGTVDLEFDFQQTSTAGNFVSGVYGEGGVGVAAPVAYAGSYVVYANRLTVGTSIGPTSAFAQEAPYTDVLASRFSGTFYGQFVTSTGAAVSGWTGFEFTATDGIHYGAVDLSTSRYVSASSPGGITFLAAEYESVAGTPLVITTPAAVPEPSSLAALAFGAAGAAGAVLRRRRTAAQTAA